MKSAMIFGLGNVGSELARQLSQRFENIYGVRRGGIYHIEKGCINVKKKVGEFSDWKKYAEKCDIAFICIPTDGDDGLALQYSLFFLEQDKPAITCEKAAVAYHWDKLKKYIKRGKSGHLRPEESKLQGIFKYTASVGGGTQMLKKIDEYKPEDIREINAVVNGTLNYISWSLMRGKDVDTVILEVLKRGYAEPGVSTFEEIVTGEMRDVVLKTVILANHSGLFDFTVHIEDIEITSTDAAAVPTLEVLRDKRCIVRIAPNKKIQAGFIEDAHKEWLPDGVLNTLYINGGLKAVGPGAGAEATVSSMIADLDDLKNL